MKLFQEVDTDNDGVICSEAFVIMYKKMNIQEIDDDCQLSQKLELELN